MKSLSYFTLIILIASGSCLFYSCEKDYPTKVEFTPYEYTGLDENGGTWKTTLLTSKEQILIDAPLGSQSNEYKAELTALKNAVSAATASDKEAVDYWGNNPILRWNEIARELAAKYNLTPAPNADGTYPGPSAANPGQYPLFPFAHPPYACRAFAYLSVAQFDALIATWHYKYKYNRPAVHVSDHTIAQTFAANNLPSYPSDGAVISAVSRDILSALFPLEKQFLADKANEMKKSLIISGLNVESDIIAGDSLGRGIAKVFLKRASTDGMSKAQTPKPVSDSIRQAAVTRFGWQWSNLESPQRPVGIAPFFGKVKMWNVPTVEEVRPVAPPAIDSPDFKKAADELIDIADNLTNEQRKIANWWGDGLGTYTPPGHWNKFATDFVIQYKFNPLRAARVYAYMNMAIQDAGISCWDAKYYYHYPRPIQAIPGFKTILGTPNFPSYTSGHSTFSSAAATVLAHIFPAEKTKVDGYANEAADSRVYAGIHFRFDSDSGLTQGRKVAEYTINKAIVDGSN
ncbi:MAG: phosphatase PAP2 family protein [Saprospiraceae bacterium]|nr:phosphatase PAP2 family protein [Saprospiraceae bacterium]